MSIERNGFEYTTTCDVCCAELPPKHGFIDAVESQKRHGLTSRKDKDGDWWDVCQECRDTFIEKDF